MRRRHPQAALAGLLLAGLALTPRAARADLKTELAAIESRVQALERRFAAWDYDAAIAGAEALYREAPDLPPVQRMAAIAKFHRQDYEGAIALFTRSSAGRPTRLAPEPLLERARATQEVTRDYASYTSEHFELRVPRGVDEVLAAYALPALEGAWKAIGDDFDFHPKGPIVVEAYERVDDLSAASGLSADAIKTSGTIAICKYNKLMFTSPKALLRGYAWLDTLSHEYVHYVVSRISGNKVPIWLHEGLAKYEESRWNGAAGRALSPFSESLLLEAISGRRALVTFEAMSPSMALLPSQEVTALAFAEVFSLIDYLVAARGGYPNLRAIIDALKAGKSDRAAIRAVYGQTFESLQRDWKAWLKEQPMHALDGANSEHLTFREDVRGKASESAEDDGDPTGELDSKEARNFAHLGELLRIEGRPRAAVAEYEKAYALAGADAVHLANKLARTLLGVGDTDRAEQVLQAALAPSPALVTTHVNLGRLYLKARRYDAALAAYLRAIELNPFDPEVHHALATIYQVKKKDHLARAEARAFELTRTRIAARRRQRSAREVPEAEQGFLSIHTTPWASIRIDREAQGLTTPLFRHPLPPGEHDLVFRIGGRVVLEKKMTLKKGQTEILELELEDPERKEQP